MNDPEIAVKIFQPIRYDSWIDDGHSVELILPLSAPAIVPTDTAKHLKFKQLFPCTAGFQLTSSRRFHYNDKRIGLQISIERSGESQKKYYPVS